MLEHISARPVGLDSRGAAMISDRERAVLLILDGSPTGCTEYNLVKYHAVALSTIYRLIERGLIRSKEHTVWRPSNWRTLWVLITDAGRTALNS